MKWMSCPENSPPFRSGLFTTMPALAAHELESRSIRIAEVAVVILTTDMGLELLSLDSVFSIGALTTAHELEVQESLEPMSSCAFLS